MKCGEMIVVGRFTEVYGNDDDDSDNGDDCNENNQGSVARCMVTVDH